MLALATKKLGDVGAGRRRQPRHKGVDNLLLLGDRESRCRDVAHDVSAHRVRCVLRGEQRVSGSLPEINAGRPPRTLTISVRDEQLDVPVILGIGCRGSADASSRKRIGDRVDGDGLRIAEQGTCLPTGGPLIAGCHEGDCGSLVDRDRDQVNHGHEHEPRDERPPVMPRWFLITSPVMRHG
jgi:hypothetical protein